MVTNQQVKKLMKETSMGIKQEVASMKSGMSVKTARKYIHLKKLPSDIKQEHTWSTRKDPFSDDWEWIQDQLEINSGLEAKTIFQELQRKYPGKYQDNQLRTLQRRLKSWHHLKGPNKEAFFPQKHIPGELCSSDFTSMNKLGIMIQGEPFKHLFYHFTLTYSNWETGTICFSESIASLSEGIQNALFELGGVPKKHRTDRLTAAVHKVGHPEKFTNSYKALLNHYGLKGETTQPSSPNENGDIESRNKYFKKAIGQALILRGSNNFNDRSEYEIFLRKILTQLNSGRLNHLKEEFKLLKALPLRRLDSLQEFLVTVGKSSTIHILHNTYSVPSRLIGAKVKVKVYAEKLILKYAKETTEIIPRLQGEYKYFIQYRHIIDWLIRKPGAFENYRYRDALYPTTYFRMAYDELLERMPATAHKEYLKVLHLASKETESKVNEILKSMFNQEKPILFSTIKESFNDDSFSFKETEVQIADVNLTAYDELFDKQEVCNG